MSSQSNVPRGRAGKTVKRPVEDEQATEESAEDVSSSAQSDPGSDRVFQAEENLSQVPASTYVATPPAVVQADNVAPEDLNVQLVANFSTGQPTLVHVTQLRWDTTQSWGQIRKLNKELVARYVRALESEPLRLPIKVLVRDLGSGVINFTPDRSKSFFPLRQ